LRALVHPLEEQGGNWEHQAELLDDWDGLEADGLEEGLRGAALHLSEKVAVVGRHCDVRALGGRGPPFMKYPSAGHTYHSCERPII
jgi:hypothetical protein